MRHFWLGLLVSLPFSFSAEAADYAVDKGLSSITFSGAHANKPFTGVFEKWDAAIRFDAQDLASSHIEVTIDTGSAKIGNPMFDNALPAADWLDAKNHPKAVFVSDVILRDADDGSYTVKGKLTLREKTLPVSFPFRLSGLDV
ncbi:MAG: YceI family protein, partial [Rickettsiales bacterium]|nr:YceI family protein [Rickettsiales bacterium]